MMERRTQAIMDRLDGLLGNRSGSKIGEPNSGEPGMDSRVNFNEQPNRRRTSGSTRGRGSSSSYAAGDNRPLGLNIRGSSTDNRPTSNERPTQYTLRLGDEIPLTGVMQIKEEVITVIRTEGKFRAPIRGQ